MKTLVTGASGFVGRLLCSELIRLGQPVRAALRTSSNFDLGGCEVVNITDINATTDWDSALKDISTVIHLAARVHVMRDNVSDPLAEFRRVNVAGTERLAYSAAANGVKRLVYVSSIKVNGEETQGGQRFSEADAPCPQDPYGVSKMEAELALRHIARKTGLEVVIVRPPLVYGAGVKGNFAQMLKVLSKGIPLPFASVHNQRSLIYVGNLVDALIVCAMHPAAVGNTYLVSDGEDISTPDLLRQLGAAIGCPVRLFPCSPAFLKLAGQLVGKSAQVERLLGALCVDSGKIQRELNWCPPYTLRDGLHNAGSQVRHVGEQNRSGGGERRKS
jgi:nucleoside-diphosphate-sugar epimerase